MLFRTFFASIIAACMLLAASCAGETKPTGPLSRLTILHFNDTHGRLAQFKVQSGDYRGGVARRSAYIRGVRAENPDTLVLQAGDILTGTVYSTIYKGAKDVEFMKGWGQTATCIGNHELDYGLSNALALSASAGFPFLSANIKRKDGSALFSPYLCTNISGADVCVIGLSAPEDGVYNRDAVKEIRLVDPAVTLSNLLYGQKLRETNGVVILLNHLGYEADLTLAAAFPDADVIVGGHSHTLIPVPVRIGPVLVVQAGQWGEYVGRLDFFISGGRVKSSDYGITPMDAAITPDPIIEAAVSNLEASVKRELDVPIGVSAARLDFADIRSNSSALGNLVADILASAVPCDAAIINGGGIRAGFPEGPVSLLDVYSMLPFDNTLFCLTLTGKQLRETAERGFSQSGNGGFLHWSSAAKVEKTAAGTSLTLGGKSVEDGKTYVLAVSDFLYKGGDSYTLLAGATRVENTGVVLRDAVAAALKKAGGITRTMIDTNRRVVLK